MNILIYINTKKLNTNLKEAMAEYTKRLSAYCKVGIQCKSVTSVTELESFLSEAGQSEHSAQYQILTGKATPSSEELADSIRQSGVTGISQMIFWVGYPLLTEDKVLPLYLTTVSMSKELTGVVLCEQLYRSFRIITNQPYHK